MKVSHVKASQALTFFQTHPYEGIVAQARNLKKSDNIHILGFGPYQCPITQCLG